MLTRTLCILVILGNLFFVYKLFVGDQGVVAYLDLKARHAQLEERLERLKGKSLEMSQDIRGLKSRREHIEQNIRAQTNYLKQDEILYVFPEEADKRGAGAASHEEQN